MNKRYWLRGGVVGIILGVLISLFTLSKSSCFGTYMNSDGTLGTNCPQSFVEIFVSNVTQTNTLIFIIVVTLLFFVGFTVVGVVYGKVRGHKESAS